MLPFFRRLRTPGRCTTPEFRLVYARSSARVSLFKAEAGANNNPIEYAPQAYRIGSSSLLLFTDI